MILLRIVSRATLFSDLFLTMVKSSDLRGDFGQQLIAAFPYPHERILHQFLGPVHGDEPRGVGAHGLVITPEECVETRLVAPAKQIDNSPVVLYFGGCHPFVCCVVRRARVGQEAVCVRKCNI